jgi:acetyl esterase
MRMKLSNVLVQSFTLFALGAGWETRAAAEEPTPNPTNAAVAPGNLKPRTGDEVRGVAKGVPHGKVYIYKRSGGQPQELEVYFPPKWDPAANQAPGVIFFHGGTWTQGDLSYFRYQCRYLASRGLVAATANYRMLPKEEQLSPGESRKRVCITDGKSAIRWMKQHAAELGVDPNRIIAGGGSAGGHIAVLATLTPELDDPNDPKDIDTKVVALLLFNPAFQASSDNGDATVTVPNQLKTALPPAIIFFGSNDQLKKPADDILIQNKGFGNSDAEMWVAPNQRHGFFNGQPWLDLTLAQADRFLVEHGLLQGVCTLPPPKGGQKLIREQ